MRVIIVGDTGVKDAVIAAPFATDAETPILFVKKGSVPSAVAAELTRLDPSEILVFGGTVRVSDAVVAALGQWAPVERVAGSSVYATAVAASRKMYPPEATPPEPDVLWNGDTETGDLSQWHNSPSVSGNGTAEASTENPHTGVYGLKLTANGSAGIRMKVQTLGPDPKNLPDDAVYSAWYYIPFEGLRDNIFQFKQADVDRWDNQGNPTHQTRRMLSKISLEWNGTGYDVAYRTRIRQASGGWSSGEADELARVDTNLPINEWFHVEMRYVWGRDGTGRSTLRIDGQEIWDLRNISTEANNLTYIQEPRQWAVNHYLSQSGTTWIYIDDAAIASSWAGPNG
jgi:hypothetical protein